MTDEIESAEDFTDRIWFGLTNLKLQAEVAARESPLPASSTNAASGRRGRRWRK